MDENLSEQEQIERIKQWWREHGWYLLGGVAVSALGILGWNQYQNYRDARAEEAAALYQSMLQAVEEDRAEVVSELLERLRDEYAATPYDEQASLLYARSQLVRNPAAATDALRYALENADDEELAMIARLRLARTLAYREQYDEALALLDVSEPGRYAASLQSIKGDIHAELSEPDAARTAYTQALTAPGGELLDRNLLQMKLSELPGDSPVAPTLPDDLPMPGEPGEVPMPGEAGGGDARVSPQGVEPSGGAADDAPPADDAPGGDEQ